MRKSCRLPFSVLKRLEGDLKRLSLQRTPVEIRVGKPFGPLAIDPTLRGRAKRRELDKLGKLMMTHIARLATRRAKRRIYSRHPRYHIQDPRQIN